MTAATVTGHFGEWVQGRFGPDGPVVLITLPCHDFRVTAPGDDTMAFDADVLSRFAARLGIDNLPTGVTRNFPLGIGGGASTATLVALARAAGFTGTDEKLANACIAAEQASDPLMFADPDRLVWASRQGRVLRKVTAPPTAIILGGLWGAPQRTDATDTDFDDVSDLIDDWQVASDQGELTRLASIATSSAQRCTARRGPADPMADLARDLGALGMVRAHTGSARGLVFAPDTVPPHGADALREAGLTDILCFQTGRA